MKGNNDNICPIDSDTKLWMENAFLWLVREFGKEIAFNQILLPIPEHFPFYLESNIDQLNIIAEIVAQRMSIDINIVDLQIFNQNKQQRLGELGHEIFTKYESDEELSSGLYFEINQNGKYEIFIEEQNLNDFESLVATLAHEFSHIRILGEGRLKINDESLTDLLTVIFGFGIFNANSAYKENKTFEGWSYRSIGYLKQREWGYALALYAYFRNEKTPNWINYLTSNIKSDFLKSEKYIQNNPDLIFKEIYKGNQ